MNLNKVFKISLILLIGFNVWIWSFIWSLNNTENAVYFLDVGQGDSQLVVLDAGKGVSPVKILIDGGEDRRVLRSLDDAVGGVKTRYIDVLIMTHPHLDHFGGFVDVLREYEVGLFITNGHEPETDSLEFANLLNELEKKEVPILVAKEGDKITFKETEFFIISPDDYLLDKGDLNEASIVIMLEHGRNKGEDNGFARVLFTGDIGFPAEDILVEKGYDLNADILKVGHHGSRHSTGANFLAAVEPAVSVIGVGSNRFGHPADEVLELLDLAGSEIFRTDNDGTIKIILDEGSAEGFVDEFAEGGGGSDRNSGSGFLDILRDVFTGGYAFSDSVKTFYLDDLRAQKREFSLVPYEICNFGSGAERARRNVVINEVAWMGAESGHSHEWIELWNVSGAPVDLSGWQIINENGRIHAQFPQQSVFSKEYILIARNPAVDPLNLNPDLTFSGVIRNSNEGLRLFDNKCLLVDEVLAFPAWPAGDNSTKQTMELVSGVWVNSLRPGGTPGRANTGRIVTSTTNQKSAVSPSSSGAGGAGSSAAAGCSSGQININTAPKSELLKIRHIGDARADSIISNRPYSSVSDMQSKVSGIGESRIKDILAEGLACVE